MKPVLMTKDDYNYFIKDKDWACFPSPFDPKDYPFRWFYRGAELPEVVNYEPYMRLRWQGKFGTCVAFSSIHIRNLHETMQGDLPQGGLSPLYLYVRCKDKDGIPDKEGTYPRVAMGVMKNEGICPESMMPYSMLTDINVLPEINPNAVTEAGKFKIRTYAKVESVEEIKQALAEQGPVMLAAIITASFYQVDENGYIPAPNGPILGGHAITVCGYDEKRQAFRIANSWEGWGQDGFAWLPYELFEYKTEDGFYHFIVEAWTLVDLEWTPDEDDFIDNIISKDVVFQIGNKTYWVNGNPIEMDVAPEIKDGRTMLPLRYCVNGIGKLIDKPIIVDWKAEEKKVILKV